MPSPQDILFSKIQASTILSRLFYRSWCMGRPREASDMGEAGTLPLKVSFPPNLEGCLLGKAPL